MTSGVFTTPNWSQALIARAAGLNPDNIAVRHEDSLNIAFLQYVPRQEILVCKKTGNIIRS